MKNKVADIVLGLIFVCAGVLLAGKLFFDWDYNIFFNGWWTLFIVVPCLISMIKGGINVGNAFGVGLGAIFFIACNGFFGLGWGQVWKMIVILLLIAIGISIIFRKNSSGNYIKEQKSIKVDGGISEYNAVFCGNDFVAQGEEFNGASANAVFGGVELNLRNAIISKDVIINCSATFGGIDILLPSNVKVRLTTTPVFGGVDNAYTDCQTDNAPIVYVNATCVFGGVDIK